PHGLPDWSLISLIEASHFDPATAYAAVDRSVLDDQTPYIYRTHDYGASWQLVTKGISPGAFLRAVREDPYTKGLLFAGTELGVYVSFNDGDQWAPLQLNLPVSSVRDLVIHGDDLVIATHGRSFWILDNITPLRQSAEAASAKGAWLYHPADAIRVDNDSFTGTPLPPEEPTAENPPNGATIDYVLKSDASRVQLELYDQQHNLVRRFSSEDRRPDRHTGLAIAERWLPKPQVLQKTAGIHRFVWNLTWRASDSSVDEDDDSRPPTGPKVVPGIYQVRLTVDGQVQNQALRVTMDPRSPATREVLQQQLELGKQIFAEALEARRALAEINSVQRQITDVEQKLGGPNPQLKAALAEAQAQIGKILADKENTPGQSTGLQDAYSGLASALRAVESGDRPAPAQAMAVYQESSQQSK